MNFRNFQSPLLMGMMACGIVLSGCQSKDRRARRAFDQFQAAEARGDLPAERRALLALVTADDTVADYWVQLGKAQAQLGDYGGAFNAFQRAHELDRANPSVLDFITQIALRSGNLPLAEKSAHELELVAPSDPAVPLTYGYVALRQGNFAEADRQAKILLATTPNDPSANVLRARVLFRSETPEKAIALLREQVRLQPSDELSLRALLSIYELREQWADAATIAGSLLALHTKDSTVRARLIDSEIRSGGAQAALRSTIVGLEAAEPRELELLLSPWVATGDQSIISPKVLELASKSQGDRRLALARFLALADYPEQVRQLTAGLATVPVNAGNLAANALYGAALAAVGQTVAGLDRLNAVLELDGGNADALRGRAKIRSRMGAHKLAIEDAQKLIASDRSAPQSRLLLANLYTSAGQIDNARRTLWDSFHEIPAERSIYEALRMIVSRSDAPSGVQLLTEEFNDQRNDKMTRTFS